MPSTISVPSRNHLSNYPPEIADQLIAIAAAAKADILALQSQVGGGLQAGTLTLVGGTKTVNTGITITAASKVFLQLNTPSGATQGVKYKVPDASLVVGGQGTGAFTATAVDNTGAAVATDVSTLNYLIIG